MAPALLDWQYPFTAASDGAGGIFVCWSSSRLFASRITSHGDLAPGWPEAGLRYGGDPQYLYRHITNLPDASGGTFVVFNAKDCVAHCGADPSERRVLRLTGEGAPSDGWPARGVPVGGGLGPVGFGGGDAGMTAAIPDGRGGLIVAWGRHVGWHRGDPVELRVQRMDGSGNHLWGDSGRVVRTATLRFPLHAVAPDERGGAILVWLDERGPHLYAQRLSPEGAPLWAVNGIPLASDSVVAFMRPVAIEDGSRGAFVTWFGATGRDTGLFAIRVTAGGGLPWRGPLRVLAASSGIDWVQLVPARNGDALLAWRDARVPGNETIHAQRISHGGKLEWSPGGLPVCTAPGHKDYLAVASDDQDGAYLAWGDTRPAGEVFATHLDRRGNTVSGWDLDGTPVCPPVAAVWEVKLVNDAAGNAVVAWTDERIPTSGYPLRVTQAMRLLPHGPAARAPDAVAESPKQRAMPNDGRAVPIARFALRGMSPNPGARAGLMRFSLPDAAPSRLELFDMAGRRLWSREVGRLGAGEHAVRLADGAWLPPGIYLARLVRGEMVASARLAIVR
ncbi:MAG: hypothetical protein HZC42_01695 [Candidatus Eisenbacteria bacterium]|nr:hypothetical protein [Candidatus Eisenbacteria bacterium]